MLLKKYLAIYDKYHSKAKDVAKIGISSHGLFLVEHINMGIYAIVSLIFGLFVVSIIFYRIKNRRPSFTTVRLVAKTSEEEENDEFGYDEGIIGKVRIKTKEEPSIDSLEPKLKSKNELIEKLKMERTQSSIPSSSSIPTQPSMPVMQTIHAIKAEDLEVKTEFHGDINACVIQEMNKIELDPNSNKSASLLEDFDEFEDLEVEESEAELESKVLVQDKEKNVEVKPNITYKQMMDNLAIKRTATTKSTNRGIQIAEIKLSLANKYIALGDIQNAKDAIYQVIETGTPELKRRATKLLELVDKSLKEPA